MSDKHTLEDERRKLERVIDGELDEREHSDDENDPGIENALPYRNFILTPQGSGWIKVFPAGYSEQVFEFQSAAFDDVDELADRLDDAADRLADMSVDEKVRRYGVIYSTGPAVDDANRTFDPDEYREHRETA